MAIAIGLLKMLLELLREKKSGVVDVASTGARARLFVEDGVLVYAGEGIVEDTLGRILVREKVLREEQYVAALEWLIERHSAGKEMRLGEVLVELEMLTEEQVHAALSAQVQQKVVRALGWTAAEPTLMESHGTLDVGGRFPTPLEPLLVAALRAADPAKVTALFAQSTGRYPALLNDDGATRSEIIVRVNALELPPAEQDFARRLDGSRSVAEILDADERIDVKVVLAALLLLDCLDLHATAQAPRAVRPPRPSRKGARPTSTTDAPSLTSRSSVRAPFAKSRERARGISARLRAAREVKPSSNRALPIVSDAGAFAAPVTRLHAESAFQLGKTLVRANRMAMALAELRRAAVLYPVAEYELWAAWAALRTEPSEQRVRGARLAAERALEEDPRFGFAHFVLGHLVLREGDAARADALFERARALEPALTLLRDVTFRRRERPPPKAPPLSSAPPRTRAPEPEAPDEAELQPPLRRTRAPTFALAAIGLVACGVLGWALGRPGEASPPPVEATHSSSAVLVDAAETDVVEAGSDASDDDGGDEDAGVELDAEAGVPLEELPPFVGAIELPPEASGHRLYIDGKMVGVVPTPIAPVKMGCGRRTVRVGSGGRDREVDVPCRGRVALSYP